MKTLALTLATVIILAMLQLATPVAKADPVCLTSEIISCYGVCHSTFPANCVVTRADCIYYGGPICVCESFCTISPHLPDGNGGFHHLEVRIDGGELGP